MKTYSIKCDHKGENCCIQTVPMQGLANARDEATFAGWFIGKKSEATYCPNCFKDLNLIWTGTTLITKK